MLTASSSRLTRWRILGFGKHAEIAAAIQEKLRALGFQATNFVLINDDAGDAQLSAELKRAECDGVAIGGYYINGQDAGNFPATEETTIWFNRVLNRIHANAPRSKIVLVRAGGHCAWHRTCARKDRVLNRLRPLSDKALPRTPQRKPAANFNR
jgi:hypothetical protein